jgi:hypothetical protein
VRVKGDLSTAACAACEPQWLRAALSGVVVLGGEGGTALKGRFVPGFAPWVETFVQCVHVRASCPARACWLAPLRLFLLSSQPHCELPTTRNARRALKLFKLQGNTGS